jgi:Skp family chaperone for outer membrane proteins
MDSNNNKNLPSEKLQKEFENNPFTILESIRNESENKDISTSSENSLKDKDNEKRDINSPDKDTTKNDEENNIMKTSFDFVKNNKHDQKDVNRKKNIFFANNINNVNTNNNYNCHNTLVNYNQNINFNKNNNIIVNHLNIFFNFNGSNINSNTTKNVASNNRNIVLIKNVNKTNYYNNFCMNNNQNSINSNCKRDTYFCNNNIDDCLDEKIFCNNNIIDLDQINFDNNDDNNFLLSKNIEKLLDNLKSYKGSLISQSYLDTIEKENELEIFFKNIVPHICQIMCSDYGNYFFQKLIKKLNFEQRLNIYKIIESEFLVIATNKCGNHSIQSLMDTIQTPLELLSLNKLLSKNMLLLFIDDNAYHIMMKMILDFPEEKRSIVNIYLVMNIEKIIINVNGAFCANKFIIKNNNLNLRKFLVENLKNNIKKLLFNKYSCIILLLVLQTFGLQWGNFIIKEIEQNFVVLSQNPISNIFIIKVLDYLKNSQNFIILKLLIWSLYKNIALMNYLISSENNRKLLNKLIEYSDAEQKQFLIELLKKSIW